MELVDMLSMFILQTTCTYLPTNYESLNVILQFFFFMFIFCNVYFYYLISLGYVVSFIVVSEF